MFCFIFFLDLNQSVFHSNRCGHLCQNLLSTMFLWNLTWTLSLREKWSFLSLRISVADIWINEFGWVSIKLRCTYISLTKPYDFFSILWCLPRSISNKEINTHYLFNEKTSTELGTHSNVEAKDEEVEFTAWIVCFFAPKSRISASLRCCPISCAQELSFCRIGSLKIHKEVAVKNILVKISVFVYFSVLTTPRVL